MARLGVLLLLLALPVTGQETVPCLAVAPREPWRAERWPLVVLLVEPGGELRPAADQMGRLTQTRGALLMVLHGRSEEALRQALHQVEQVYPVADGGIYLMARDAMAEWARQVALRSGFAVRGLLTVDAPAIEVPRGQGRSGLKVAMLVVRPERAAANQRLAGELQRRDVPCALAVVKDSELNLYIGAALTQMLPGTPARREVFDPVTRATMKAPDGWEFVRHDYLFATAHRTTVGGPHIEVATGTLGKLTFDGYVDATLSALREGGIELFESVRLVTPKPTLNAHAFFFLDRRQPNQAQHVYWVQVAHGPRIVSFRCAASREELTTWQEAIRNFALSVAFDN